MPWAGGKDMLQCDDCPFNIVMSGRNQARDERLMQNHIRVRHLSPQPRQETMLRDRRSGESRIVGPDGRPLRGGE